MDLQELLDLIPKKDVIFIIGDWNAKVGSIETPGITGKFGLGAQDGTEQREGPSAGPPSKEMGKQTPNPVPLRQGACVFMG